MSKAMEAAQSFTSPLAQIFQPLVVDDDVVADMPQHSPQPLVSFGPASRRRLSSMTQHRRDGGNGHSGTSPQKTPSKDGGLFGSLKRFPGMSSDDQIAESPSSMSSMRSKQPTASDVMEGEAESGGVDRRMDEIERTQKKIEKLLEKIAESLDVKTD